MLPVAGVERESLVLQLGQGSGLAGLAHGHLVLDVLSETLVENVMESYVVPQCTACEFFEIDLIANHFMVLLHFEG